MARQMARRRVLWACGALSAMALGLALQRAPAADAAATFTVAILAQIVLAVVAWRTIGREEGWDDAIHTDARWTALLAMRTLAAILLFSTIAAAAVTSLLGVAMPRVLPAVAFAAACACAAGWTIEHRPLGMLLPPPRAKVKPAREAARTLYRTRGGAVLAIESPAGRDLVFTGNTQVARLSEVERAIDERGWNDAKDPTPRKLRDALARWGTIEEERP